MTKGLGRWRGGEVAGWGGGGGIGRTHVLFSHRVSWLETNVSQPQPGSP